MEHKTVTHFLESKPLTLTKDLYGGYKITHAYLVALLEEYSQSLVAGAQEEKERELAELKESLAKERKDSNRFLGGWEAKLIEVEAKNTVIVRQAEEIERLKAAVGFSFEDILEGLYQMRMELGLHGLYAYDDCKKWALKYFTRSSNPPESSREVEFAEWLFAQTDWRTKNFKELFQLFLKQNPKP